jgi:hypothetical protein
VLKLKYEELLSNFAFNFSLRRYSEVLLREPEPISPEDLHRLTWQGGH